MKFDGFKSMHWETEYTKHIEDVSIYPKGQGEIRSESNNLVTIFLEESYLVPALAGEIGELCSIFAKSVRDSNGDLDDVDIENIKKELGDILFMVASLANLYGVNLKHIAEMNTAKLLSRKERGVISGSGDNR